MSLRTISLGAVITAQMLFTPVASAAAQGRGDYGTPDWIFHVGASGYNLLQSAFVNGGPGITLGLGQRISAQATVMVRGEFIHLGHTERVRTLNDPPQNFTDAYRQDVYSSKMLSLGVAVEHRLTPSANGVTLLADLGALGYNLDGWTQIVDEPTSNSIYRSSEGWSWGPQLGLGARYGLFNLSSSGAFGIEARVRGAVVHSSDAWTTIRYVSAGIVFEM